MEQTFIYALHDPRDWAIVYIGKSNDPQKRLKDHRLRLKDYSLQISILQRCPVVEWQHWEKFWISVARNVGYARLNMSDGGDGILIPRPFSAAHKAKLSASRIGMRYSSETIKKMGAASRLRRASPETRRAMSIARKGKHFGPMSQRGRENIRAVRIGTTIPLEVRAKMSASHVGKIRTMEHREKLSKALRGRKATLEARSNMSLAHIGKKTHPCSDETKKKLSAAAKAQWVKWYAQRT